jgi:hypothetical protein
LSKRMLITSNQQQSEMVLSHSFNDRCNDELGYQPVLNLKRISPFDLVGLVNIISLQADPEDPLDP